MYIKKKQRQGFTLIELLIVVSIIFVLGLISYPSYSSFLARTLSEDQEVRVTSLYKKARDKSYYGVENRDFGVFYSITDNKFYFYQGPSFVERNQEYPLESTIDFDLDISQPTTSLDIVFRNGKPNINTEKLFTYIDRNNHAQSFVINNLGTIH